MGPWGEGELPVQRLLQVCSHSKQPASFPRNTAVGAATSVVPTSHAELSSTGRKQVVDPLLFAHPQPMCPEDARREPRQCTPS